MDYSYVTYGPKPERADTLRAPITTVNIGRQPTPHAARLYVRQAGPDTFPGLEAVRILSADGSIDEHWLLVDGAWTETNARWEPLNG